MGFDSQFTARAETRNGVTRIALSGELDLATTPMLSDHLFMHEADGPAGIMLDLGDLTFLDCSGLREILASRERADASGHRFTLLSASPTARRLFEITQTECLLDEQAAVSLLDLFTGTVADRVAPMAVSAVSR